MTNGGWKEIANGAGMWIAVIPTVIMLCIQAIVFIRHAVKHGELAGLTKDDINTAIKAGTICTIGPSMSMFTVMVAFMDLVGAPYAWLRLSIIGTITTGIVSPTEAGAIAVVYGLIVGGLVYRELTLADIKFAFTKTVRVSGRIFVVIGAAKLFTVMLTTAGFDRWLTNVMLGVSTDPTVILIMILLLFFVVTMFMESIAALTLFMPIVYPIAMSVGVDPTVLGVLVTVVIGVGLVTPPVGMCIYVACDLMKIRVGSTMKYVIPYILGTIVCIAILIAFPILITAPGMLVGSGA